MKNITDSINTINESLEKIIAVMPGMVFWKDATGKYQGCNDNAAKLARLTSRTAIIGKTIHDLFDKDLADKVEIIDAHVIETKLEHVKEELGIDPNGNPAIFLTRKVPIFDEKNNVLGLVGISIDITSQKKLEADLIKAKKETESINEHLQIASSAKSEFISSVSHEFLTPMNAIMGMAQLLIMNSKDQESTAKLQEIMRAGDHLLGLITDILDFSKLESEKFELNEQPFSLNSLFHQTVNQLAPLLVRQAKNVELIPNYASDLPDYIIGDEKCLRQIIFNLGGNAIKFTEQGNIQINALLVSKTTDNVQIRFEFKDTGKGIAAEKLNAIFERFSQVDSSYSRQHGGVGLGLAITKKLIDRMKGRIGVESTEGVGSLFWCEVNFKLANTQQISIIKLI